MCLPRFDIEKAGFILECGTCHGRRIFIRTRIYKQRLDFIYYDFKCRDCGHGGSVNPIDWKKDDVVGTEDVEEIDVMV